jgi:hypothetical protein
MRGNQSLEEEEIFFYAEIWAFTEERMSFSVEEGGDEGSG